MFTIVEWNNNLYKWEITSGKYNNRHYAMKMADLFERITGNKHRVAEIYE